MTDKPILCRPALPLDREPVLEFLKEIWSGEDYVPDVWDDWLWREPGLLAVALRGGVVVGQGHLLDMSDGEWWLEGLRVRPSEQGQGVGSHLHDYFVERWLATSGHVVRLATHRQRKRVHSMCERTGFEREFEVVLMTGEAAQAEGQNGMVGQSLPADEMARWAQSSDQTKAQAGMSDYGWRYAKPSTARFARLSNVLFLEGDSGSSALVDVPEAKDAAAHLLSLHPGERPLESAAAAVLAWAAAAERATVDWLTPAPWQQQAELAGFVADEEAGLYVYERVR